MNDLARVITVRRALLNMSRQDLVQATGLSYPYVAELEKGSKAPGLATLGKLAAGLRFESVIAMLAWSDVVHGLMASVTPAPGTVTAGLVDITPGDHSFR